MRGIATCRGVAVAGPAYVAFVPTERPKHLASELAWGIAGFVEVGARKIPPQEVIEKLRAAPADESVEQMASGLAGRFWRARSAVAKEHRIPLRRSKRGLWFLRDNESIRFSRSLPVDEIAALRSQLADWTWQ